jgi:hypothetical protein
VKESPPVLIIDAAPATVVMVGFVAVVPALEIVTPDPWTIETVPVAPVLRILIIAPVVKATLEELGMVTVTVLVLE